MSVRPSFPEGLARRPAGFQAIGVFFFLGSLAASLAAATMLKPGTVLDRAWRLNPEAHVQLASMGRIIGIPFIVLAIALFLAGTGWLRRRYWGWVMGTLIVAINCAGDVFQMLMGQRAKGAVGILIAGLLLTYMIRAPMRRYFRGDA